MNNRSVATQEQDVLTDVHLMCTHCSVEMTETRAEGSAVRYFQCPCCQRWVSSVYADVLRGDANFRAVRAAADPAKDARFQTIKMRLEQWLSSLEEQDPYRVLGISPKDPTEKIKQRYRELAFRSHPDRGGSPDRMRELNLAWERVSAHRDRLEAERYEASRERRLPPQSR